LTNCLKLSKPHAESLSLSGNESQTVRLAIKKSQQPCVLSRHQGMTSWCRFVKHRRSRDFRGWVEMVGEVPRCLAMHGPGHHNAKLAYDSLWYVQPMELVMQDWGVIRQ